ncbi:hypothetical protein D9M69_538850 [compost metagenome]
MLALNSVMTRNTCTMALVSHRALAGTWLAFSLRMKAGMVWSLAAANMISAHSSTQDSRAPSREMTRPTLISTAPQ